MSEKAFVSSLLETGIGFPKQIRSTHYATEIKITNNRVDIIYFERKSEGSFGSVIAVEAKLRDWRKALQQSYRNKLFADRTYVALPRQYASGAIANLTKFRKADVGLIILDPKKNERAQVYYHPSINAHRSAPHVQRAHQSLTAASSTTRENRSTHQDTVQTSGLAVCIA